MSCHLLAEIRDEVAGVRFLNGGEAFVCLRQAVSEKRKQYIVTVAEPEYIAQMC
ncbi:MAG: hypothetical protein JWR32_4763 [Mycobacterium sp.]|jgi:hypothetical protein|nr:hypothetical protein [Mycobacterium sp.]